MRLGSQGKGTPLARGSHREGKRHGEGSNHRVGGSWESGQASPPTLRPPFSASTRAAPGGPRTEDGAHPCFYHQHLLQGLSWLFSRAVLGALASCARLAPSGIRWDTAIRPAQLRPGGLGPDAGIALAYQSFSGGQLQASRPRCSGLDTGAEAGREAASPQAGVRGGRAMAGT